VELLHRLPLDPVGHHCLRLCMLSISLTCSASIARLPELELKEPSASNGRLVKGFRFCLTPSAPLAPRGAGRASLGLGSTELVQQGRQTSAEAGVPCFQFADQTPGRRSEGPAQFRLVEGAHQGLAERIRHGAGEALDAAPFAGVLPEAQARQFEDVLPDATDPVFGLPELVALDARVGVQDVEPAESDEGGSAWLGRGRRGLGWTEERTEGGAAGAEVLGRRCGHVDLQPARQQEHAVDTPTERQVELVEHAPFSLEHCRPVLKDGLKPDALLDTEGHVDVGPLIPAAKGQGAGERTGDDPRVALRQFEDALPHLVALLCRKHGALLSLFFLLQRILPYWPGSDKTRESSSDTLLLVGRGLNAASFPRLPQRDAHATCRSPRIS
ncbi:MAG TPA: hypothetical protein VJ761_00980, partial [Ktedonobacteraceae bacterium]|nr:hypothetical protein [Ktedonobacteraceae bacterium]